MLLCVWWLRMPYTAWTVMPGHSFTTTRMKEKRAWAWPKGVWIKGIAHCKIKKHICKNSTEKSPLPEIMTWLLMMIHGWQFHVGTSFFQQKKKHLLIVLQYIYSWIKNKLRWRDAFNVYILKVHVFFCMIIRQAGVVWKKQNCSGMKLRRLSWLSKSWSLEFLLRCPDVWFLLPTFSTASHLVWLNLKLMQTSRWIKSTTGERRNIYFWF